MNNQLIFELNEIVSNSAEKMFGSKLELTRNVDEVDFPPFSTEFITQIGLLSTEWRGTILLGLSQKSCNDLFGTMLSGLGLDATSSREMICSMLGELLNTISAAFVVHPEPVREYGVMDITPPLTWSPSGKIIPFHRRPGLCGMLKINGEDIYTYFSIAKAEKTVGSGMELAEGCFLWKPTTTLSISIETKNKKK